ncbi:MAG: hypothetical protein AAB561_01045 [Patescibacteria group bacterium]
METSPSTPSPVSQYVPPAASAPTHDIARIVIWSVAGCIVVVFGLWYSGIFNFGISRTPAAEQVPVTAQSELTARCEGGSQPRVVLAWTKAAGMQRNALLRFSGKEDPISVFNDPGPDFTTFTYTDTDVQMGLTYHYVVVTGIRTSSNTATIEVSEVNCNTR